MNARRGSGSSSSTSTICLLVFALFCASPAGADEANDAVAGSPIASDLPLDEVPDIRDDETPLKIQKGDFVAVPIPMSSPTFGTGLIVGAAYFYAQTPEQKKSQPASFTGAAGAYTTNDSWAAGVGQQNYWNDDKWRFTGVAGYVHFKFELRDPATGGNSQIDWNLEGGIFQGTLSRSIGGHWYAGLLTRYLDITQDLSTLAAPSGFGVDSKIESVGAGPVLQYDTRDVPTNAYDGSRFDGKAIFSRADGLDTTSYQGYYLRYRSYHPLKVPACVSWC
jgi:hypothetical protein